MTDAQASYLKTLSEECEEPDSFQPGLLVARAAPERQEEARPLFIASFIASP
jgi:Protein of unknown function (DUF3072)